MSVDRSDRGGVKVVDSRDLPRELNYDSIVNKLQAYLTQMKLLNPDKPLVWNFFKLCFQSAHLLKISWPLHLLDLVLRTL